MSAYSSTKSVFTKQASIPYSGDDWAQWLARVMWLPVLVMGVMAVVGGLVAGSYSGVQLGQFFSGASLAHLGRATSTLAWTQGTVFLGMGLILSGITMTLVNIVRALRDTGRDIQVAVGSSQVRKLSKPLVAQLVPHVMMMGLMVVGAAFGLGVGRAVLFGHIPAGQLANPTTLSATHLSGFGTAQAIGAYLQPLALTGLAIIFISIVLALRTVTRTISYQGQRIQELAEEKDHHVVAA